MPLAPSSPKAGSEAGDRVLDTDHLLLDLKGRTVRGGAVTLLAQGAKLTLSLGSTMVLARLLEPSDFGALAMATAFTGVLGLFKDLGLSMATVQKRSLSAREINTLFWVNVAASVILLELAFLIAPWVAVFFGRADLLGITCALGAAVCLGGLGAQHQAVLRRQMRFGRLAMIDVGSLLIGAAVGVGAGLAGLGAWALVWMQVAIALSTLLGVVGLCPWRPGRPGRLRDVKGLLGFGADMTGFGLLNFLARNGDRVLLGRFFGGAATGLYHNAYKLMMLPLNLVNAPLYAVAVPALSPIATDEPRYREAFSRMLEKLALITLPGVALLIACSDWVVAIALGPKWTAAAAILRVLAVAALVQPLGNAVGWLFVSQGRTREQLHLGAVGTGVVLAAFGAGLAWGPVGVATGYAIANCAVLLPLQFWYAGRRGPVRARDLCAAAAPAATAALAVLGALGGLRTWAPPSGPWSGLGLSCLVALGVTLLVLIALPRGRRLLGDLRGVWPSLLKR